MFAITSSLSSMKIETLHKPVPSVKSLGIIRGVISPPLFITIFDKSIYVGFLNNPT